MTKIHEYLVVSNVKKPIDGKMVRLLARLFRHVARRIRVHASQSKASGVGLSADSVRSVASDALSNAMTVEHIDQKEFPASVSVFLEPDRSILWVTVTCNDYALVSAWRPGRTLVNTP